MSKVQIGSYSIEKVVKEVVLEFMIQLGMLNFISDSTT